tara:strand:+ start:7520 stop:9634 length:2115 start_codon:yes stop_codon:yes gene_type:complete
MANGSFQFSATSNDAQMAIRKARFDARQKHGAGRVVSQNFVQDPQTGKYTGTIIYEPTSTLPTEERDALSAAIKVAQDNSTNGTVTPTPAPTVTQAPAPDTVRNVRNNNPGNLRTGDVETAQRYYGKDAVTGVDEGGFAQFGTEGDGINALFQQIRIDSNRINEETGQPQTAEEFIDRYTPVKDDPEGNKAAKINIPKFVGATLDTPLADIDPRELALAITRQEGGNEALQAFEPGIRRSAPTLADIDNAVNEFTNRPKITAVRPDDSQFNPATDDEIANAKAQMDLSNMGGNVALTQFNTAPTVDLRDMLLRGAGLQSAEDQPAVQIRGIDGQIMEGSNALRAIGAENPNLTGTSSELETVAREQAPAINRAIRRNELRQDGKYQASIESTDPRAGQRTVQEDDTATEPTVTESTVTEPATDADQRGLLSRIGSLIANNPELAASGAQLLGGLISNAAQNRAQRRADRTTDQRVARANLISALTSGRARPMVERAQADTGGFLSLDTLGKAIQGSGAAVQSDLARRAAEELQAAKANEKDIPPAKLQEKYKAAGQVIDQVDNLVNLMEDAGAFATGFGLSTIRFLGFDSAPQFTESGKDTAEIKAAANALVQTLGQDMSGVLSNQDIQFIKEQSIDPEDNLEVALRKAGLIRNKLIQSMTQSYDVDSKNYNMTAFLPIVKKVVSGGNDGFEDLLAQDNISLGK